MIQYSSSQEVPDWNTVLIVREGFIDLYQFLEVAVPWLWHHGQDTQKLLRWLQQQKVCIDTGRWPRWKFETDQYGEPIPDNESPDRIIRFNLSEGDSADIVVTPIDCVCTGSCLEIGLNIGDMLGDDETVFSQIKERADFCLSVVKGVGCDFEGVEFGHDAFNERQERLANRLDDAFSFVSIDQDDVIGADTSLGYETNGQSYYIHLETACDDADKPTDDSDAQASAQMTLRDLVADGRQAEYDAQEAEWRSQGMKYSIEDGFKKMLFRPINLGLAPIYRAIDRLHLSGVFVCNQKQLAEFLTLHSDLNKNKNTTSIAKSLSNYRKG